MITLYQFPKGKRFPNLSPFCVKLETYFRLAGIPYQCVYTVSLKNAPKKKMPYIELSGERISDTQFIIERMSKTRPEWDLDRNLTSEQRSLTTVVQLSMEESFMYVMAHLRWADEEGWKEFSPIVFHGAPKLVRSLIGGVMHRKAKQRGWLHGVGRHSRNEIIEIATRDLEAVSTLLGDKKFFFGEKPSMIDCVLFGFLGQVTHNKLPSALTERANRFANLTPYVERMYERYNAAANP